MNTRLPPDSVYKLHKYKISPTNGEKGIKWLNRAQRKTASNQSFLPLMPLLILNTTFSFWRIHSATSIPLWLEVSCQTREQLHSWSCISGTCLSRTAAFDFECSLFAFFPKFAIRNTLMSETSVVWFLLQFPSSESQQSAITHFYSTVSCFVTFCPFGIQLFIISGVFLVVSSTFMAATVNYNAITEKTVSCDWQLKFAINH